MVNFSVFIHVNIFQGVRQTYKIVPTVKTPLYITMYYHVWTGGFLWCMDMKAWRRGGVGDSCSGCAAHVENSSRSRSAAALPLLANTALSSSRICCGCLLIFLRSSFDIVNHSRSNNAAQYTQPSSEDGPRATNRTQFYNLGKVSRITQGHCDTLSPVPYGGQRDKWT